MVAGYTLENARRFAWSSISGQLNPIRCGHLERFLIGQKILDAGCGGGGFVDMLCQRRGYDATGVDYHDMFLGVARAQNRRGTFVRGDIVDLPFEDKSFDCTFCFDVLEHVDDARAIRELARVTRRRIIVAVPREDDFFGRFALVFAHHRDPTHLRYYTLASLEALGQSFGARSVEVFPELPIPARYLVEALIEQPGPPPGWLVSPPPPAPRGLYRRLRAWVKRRLIRPPEPPKLRDLEAAFRDMLADATYREIPSGLVAVIDL